MWSVLVVQPANVVQLQLLDLGSLKKLTQHSVRQMELPVGHCPMTQVVHTLGQSTHFQWALGLVRGDQHGGARSIIQFHFHYRFSSLQHFSRKPLWSISKVSAHDSVTCVELSCVCIRITTVFLLHLVFSHSLSGGRIQQI